VARVVRFHEAGGPEVLKIEDVEVGAPKASEVQIAVKALGINRAEVMWRSGQYVIEPQYPALLGYEAAGVVAQVGPGVDEFKVGDKVSVIPAFFFNQYGMYGDLVNAPARAVVKHPDNMSFEEAAATWMMFVTAYGALVDIANLQSGDVVLIQAASSSVGLAAIQIVNMLGGVSVAMTRTSAKRDALLEAGAQHVIATSKQDLVAEVARVSNGKGARIAFDPVGGTGVPAILKSLSPLGIFFQYGALDTSDIHVPVMDLLGKDLTIRGYQLFELTMDDARLAKAKQFVNDGLARSKLRPVISKRFEFNDIVEAHKFMESNAQIGKIIVNVA